MAKYNELGGARRQLDLEEKVLARWAERDIFHKALKRREDAPHFTFYEGPPTANGRPGIHHVLARSLKDVICRFQDLAGKRVERKAGWDTHGLPVEVEVEKSLGIHGKEAIADYGVEAFTRKCVDSVFTYVNEWERLTNRIGYWLDLDSAYITYHEDYVESVWWALKSLFDKGLLYKGYKVVWWWPQGGTALSAGEVGYGYRDTDDPSVTVRFPLTGDGQSKPTSFLAWTTTPWTLPSHVALAVGADLDYVDCDLGDEIVILAKARVKELLGERPFEILQTRKGSELKGLKYEPPFRYATPENGESYLVVEGDFVSTDSGTGLVHLAPAFGEDDFRLSKEQGLGFLQLVKPDGCFKEEVTDFAGRYIKEADGDICRNLKDRGRLFHKGIHRHEYPFCWRSPQDPLIQYARKSWFVRTTAMKDRLLANNATISWHPKHIQEGRFGDFLRNNVDWALSRERFWGTPLPIWVNDVSGAVDIVASSAEILERNPNAFDAFEAARAREPELSPHLRLHKPWIDEISWTRPGEEGVYRRVKEVIDCWFDSGAMPFAQRGYPHKGQELFEGSFPADFICEGLDQTRGWFYSLLAISTLLFDKPAYKNVIVNGLVNDKDGRKMSKSLGNTLNPWDVIDAHGSDPLRWYLLAATPPWNSKNFDLGGVAEVSRKVFGTLWPCYNFFALYASIDDWTAGEEIPEDRLLSIDRWLRSRVNSLVRDYTSAMQAYDPLKAARALGSFITDELSNWYIRRNRVRFWKGKKEAKAPAFATLFHALETVAVLLAPIAPLSADALFLGLHPEEDAPESVHLCDLPIADESVIDSRLEAEMSAILQVVSLGRAARKSADIRVRQPLARIILAGPGLDGLRNEELASELRSELNVREVEITEQTATWCEVNVKPNLPVLGPRLGRKLGLVRKALSQLDDAQIDRFEMEGRVCVEIDGSPMEFGGEDLFVERKGKPGFAVAAAQGYVAVLDTQLDAELEAEGLRREIVNRLQNQRKQMGLDVSCRVAATLWAPEELLSTLRGHESSLAAEILAISFDLDPSGAAPESAMSWKVLTHEIKVLLVPQSS